MESQKGVSLIITFFVLTIMLAVVLSISILIYGEIKIIRNIGNSVVAFYAADSGVEKFLYYDRQQTPDNGKRGLCNICNVCSSDCTPGINGGAGDCLESHCQGCQITGGSDCGPESCKSCEVTFNGFFDGKSYQVTANITPQGQFSDLNIESKGDYKEVARKIQLQTIKDEAEPSAPRIINTFLSSRSIEELTILTIEAEVIDTDGVLSVIAHVQSPDENNIGDPAEMDLIGDNIYSGEWVGTPSDVYYVDIEACDFLGNCGIANNI